MNSNISVTFHINTWIRSCSDYVFMYRDNFSLKMQQGLLVDFGAFPQNVIDLLNSVLAEEQKELPK